MTSSLSSLIHRASSMTPIRDVSKLLNVVVDVGLVSRHLVALLFSANVMSVRKAHT